MSLSSLRGSSTANNFQLMAGLPCGLQAQAEAQGTCLTNIDGVCVRGGEKVAGSSGLTLASMGAPNSVCYAASIFAAGNIRYSLNGWDTTTNANPLRLARGLL